MGETSKRQPFPASGPVWRAILANALAIGVLFGFRLVGFEIPNPGTLLALAIVYASFVGGLRLGMVSAGVAFLAAFAHFTTPAPDAATGISGSMLAKLLVLGTCFPVMALLVGRLRGQLLAVSREQEHERVRRAAEVRYRQLVDSIKDYAILMLDTHGVVRSWNEGGQRIKGYRPEEIIGRHFSVFYPLEEVQAGKAELELRIAAESGRFEDEGWRVRKDGTRFWANVVLTALRDPVTGELQGYVKVTRDLSDRKRAEEKLRENGVALEAANKELEAFSYSVSHDLRAPLRGIDGFSQALLEDYQDRLDEDGRDYLRRIRAGTQRMGHLIDDLLNLSRLTRGEMKIEPVDLSALAARLVQELRAGEPGRQVKVSIQDGLQATGDPGLLSAVLQNLISNAWKFTSRRAQAEIEVGKTTEGGKTAFYVKDNGAGFDMAYADKLFGAFQRLHRIDEYSGSGVGLATVRRVIHRHGGEVWVKAGVDQGATFYFTLGTAGAGARQAA
jgi:PAS domain S-box-containing protein